MMRMLSIGALLVIGWSLSAPAADPADSPAAATARRPDLQTTAEKRQWLEDQLVQGVGSVRQIREVQRKLDRMTPQQIDALTHIALAQQLPQGDAAAAMQQARFELQRALWLRQMLANDLWWRRYNAIGYIPVIGWLPQGTSLGASAVVSPDGRYVRVSPTPFFSSVGPVYSYNLNTGETILLPQYGYGYPPGYGYPSGMYPDGSYGSGGDYRAGQMPRQHLPPQVTRQPPKVWYDGMRTRTDPRP